MRVKDLLREWLLRTTQDIVARVRVVAFRLCYVARWSAGAAAARLCMEYKYSKRKFILHCWLSESYAWNCATKSSCADIYIPSNSFSPLLRTRYDHLLCFYVSHVCSLLVELESYVKALCEEGCSDARWVTDNCCMFDLTPTHQIDTESAMRGDEDRAKTLARMCVNVSEMLSDLADYSGAIDCASKAQKIYSHVLGPKHVREPGLHHILYIVLFVQCHCNWGTFLSRIFFYGMILVFVHFSNAMDFPVSSRVSITPLRSIHSCTCLNECTLNP